MVLDEPHENLVRDEAAAIGERHAVPPALEDTRAVEAAECRIDPGARGGAEARTVGRKVEPFVETQREDGRVDGVRAAVRDRGLAALRALDVRSYGPWLPRSLTGQVGVRAGADTKPPAVPPVHGVAAALLAGLRPVRDLVVAIAGRAKDSRGELVAVGQPVVVGLGGAGCGAPARDGRPASPAPVRHALFGFERELQWIRRDVIRRQRERGLEIRGPLPLGLSGATEDQVEVHVQADRTGGRDGRLDVAWRVGASERRERAGGEGLRAERHPGRPERAPRLEPRAVE